MQAAPANFAMVMATGIVSVAAHTAGLHAAARGIAIVCAVLWAANAMLLALRIVAAPRLVWADFSSQARSPGFLTVIAGTNVLGSCCVLVFGNPLVGGMLFRVGTALWPAVILLVMFALIVAKEKMPLEKGLNGAWLLMTVSTQSIVVLGALLDGRPASPAAVLGMALLFLLGVALYFMIMPLILYRLFFKDLTPADLSATFWISAGAMAITCLAGTSLVPLLAEVPELAELVPAVKALSAGAWALASFWLPCLILLGVWRHVLRGYPFTYGVEYWSMVFPLGMYTVCTKAILGIYPFLPAAIPIYAGLAAALAAWCAVFISFCLFLAGTMRRALSP